MIISRGRKRKKTAPNNGFRLVGGSLALIAVPLLVFYTVTSRFGRESATAPFLPSGSGAIEFTDARRQAAEFISYNREIMLTARQKELMDEALSSIPAPCCSQFSIATCCCPCNLAKATWGLSKALIANQHYDAQQVKATVNNWLQFTNPGGYTGDACFTRGCDRSFERNGCGGMDEHHIQ